MLLPVNLTFSFKKWLKSTLLFCQYIRWHRLFIHHNFFFIPDLFPLFFFTVVVS